MFLKSIRYFPFLFFFLYSVASTASDGLVEPSSRGYLSMLFSPVNAVLDVVCAPLHYMSTSDVYKNREDSFKKATRILQQTHLSGEKKVEVLEILEETASTGHKEAMFYLGVLLIGRPMKQLHVLKSLVEENQDLGMQYIEAAAKAGLDEAQTLWQEIQGARMLNALVWTNFDENDNSDGQGFSSSAHERMMELAKINPHAAFYLSEAILKPKTAAYPWMFQIEISFSERRKKATPLLKYADEKGVPDARKLMTHLQEEDVIYESVCNSIMANPNIVIQNLKMGEAGFLQSYVDMLCDQTIEERGYALSKEYACFIKTIMGIRISQVYHFLSKLFCDTRLRYASELYGDKEGRGLTEKKFIHVSKSLIGKREFTLGALREGPYPDGLFVDFTQHGLHSPVTQLDLERAMGMVINMDDDVYGDQ